MYNNQMMAQALMRPQQSPVGAFASGFQTSMASDPYGMAAGGAPAGGMWGQIADFLNGRARKKPYDKTGDPGEMKSWAPEGSGDGNLASSLGVYSP
jgi:hypothetical protein